MDERFIREIQALEEQYGSLAAVPDNNPHLLLLQRKMGRPTEYNRYCITDTVTGQETFVRTTKKIRHLLHVSDRDVTKAIYDGDLVRGRYGIDRGRWKIGSEKRIDI